MPQTHNVEEHVREHRRKENLGEVVWEKRKKEMNIGGKRTFSAVSSSGGNLTISPVMS